MRLLVEKVYLPISIHVQLSDWTAYGKAPLSIPAYFKRNPPFESLFANRTNGRVPWCLARYRGGGTIIKLSSSPIIIHYWQLVNLLVTSGQHSQYELWFVQERWWLRNLPSSDFQRQVVPLHSLAFDKSWKAWSDTTKLFFLRKSVVVM